MNQRSFAAGLWGVAVLAAFLCWWKLGALGFLGPDEPRYVQVAREVTGPTGNLITPTLLGKPWFEKPILLYWLAGSGMHLWGETEGAARFPTAALAVVGVVLWAWWLRPLESARLALWSGVILTSNAFIIGFARVATCDLVLTVAVTASLVTFMRYEFRPETQGFRRYLYWSGGLVGMALLAKGLIGALLPLGIVGSYRLFQRKSWKVIDAGELWPILGAGGLALLVAGIWYGPVLYLHGWTFIQEFLIAHHFQRFTSHRFHHSGPWYYYLPVILGGMFPWTLFFLHGFRETCRNWHRLPARDLFWVLWILVPLLFFSFSGSKLPGYILPTFPACALLTARGLVNGTPPQESRNWLTFAAALTLLLLGVTAVGIGWWGHHETGPAGAGFFPWVAIAVILPLGGSFLIWQKQRFHVDRTSVLGFTLTGWMVAFIGCAPFTLFPLLENRESFKALSLAAIQAIRPDESFAFYRCRKYAPVFYLSEKVECCDQDREPNRFESPPEVRTFLSGQKSRQILLMAPQAVISDFSAVGWKVTPLATQANLALLRVEPVEPLASSSPPISDRQSQFRQGHGNAGSHLQRT